MTDLVLLPGLMCTSAMWSHQLAHLGDVARVHVPDISGADSLSGLAQGVLENAPERFALAGLSLGGMVCHEIMRRAPERVERLALVSSSARPDTDEQVTRRRALLEMEARGEFPAITALMLPMLVHESKRDDAAIAAALVSMADAVGGAGFRRQVAALIGRPDSRPDLADYHCPTMIICGRDDALTGLDHQNEMADRIPGAELAVIEQCGHISAMEQPQAVTALLRLWLLRD